jgi:hypothetical protein
MPKKDRGKATVVGKIVHDYAGWRLGFRFTGVLTDGNTIKRKRV